MMIMGRTRAVADKLVKDIEKIIFWTTILVQAFFFFFYGYSIYTNVSKTIFLIIYSVLCALSLFNFTYVIASHPYRKSDNVKKVKTFIRIFRYIVNGTMLGVNIYEMVMYGASDFNKMMIIVSGASLFGQIVLELVRIFTENYINLFMTSVQMDLSLFTKLNKMKEANSFYEFVDIPLEALANKLEGKEEELTDKEKKVDDLYKEFKPKYEQKQEEKRRQQKENNPNTEERKSNIKEHLKTIKENLFKKNNQ